MDAPDSDLHMENPDLEAAMGSPVTASLGPVGPLLRQLRELTTRPEGVSEGEIQRLRRDLEDLCVSLMHHSEAEAEEPLSSTAKCWMREVRELCYDTKNYLDDAPFIFSEQDHDAKLTQEEKQENAQFEFEMLVARAKNASKRRQRYEIDHNSINKTTKLPSTGRRFPVLHPELIDRGRMDKLASMLGNEEGEQLKVVSLVGLEGVGKTTLAKRIYHKTGGQFDCGAFVRVSPNPDMRRLLTTIFTQIQSPGFSSSEGVSQHPCCLDAQDLITKIKDYLRDKRYLIIIDDLWSTSVWDIIRRAFPDGDCHSRIITTTQSEDVASACCSYQSKYKFEMEPLKYDQSRKLFFGMVFGSEDKVSFPEGFGEVSSEIIKKCGGLPLSMVNIASLLSTEESEINLQQWKDIRDSLPPTLKTNPTSEGMEKVINLIYNNLSPELKTCLLYLAVYPEGYTSNKDDLVKQWVTEGFTREGQNKEEIAREYFDELVSRGMIQPVDINYRGVLSCTLHHMVHDLIVKKSMEGNFIVGVDNFQSATWLPNKVRRLSVQFGGARSARIPAGITLSEVQSLAFFGFYGCADFIECKLLRVLILHVWTDEDKVPFDLSGISKLLPLRYVKIACNIAVKLPDKIQDLQYLETLEVDTLVVAIPSGIGKLSRLSSLKIAVRVLSRQDICILQALPALSALSLHVWTTPDKMIVFNKGEFLVLKYFKFSCPVPWLKFEAGSMPDLRNLKLCFNAHEADQHGTATISIEHLPGLKAITANIWGADKLKTAISNHPSNPRIDVHLVDRIFHGDATLSMGTEAKENMCEDEDKVEDEKKQAADSRMSMLPRSKRTRGSSSRVHVQGTEEIIDELHKVDAQMNKKSKKDTSLKIMSSLEVTDLTLNLLENITNKFSKELKIGSGGYGEVYRAVLNGHEIAVKKLYLMNGIDDKSFANEFRQLMKVQHENIIRLIAYCYEIKHKHTHYEGELVFSRVIDRALCFEYIPEGSLANHISDDSCVHDWATTYNIIKGTSEGLHYLHRGRGQGQHIYHLDLKPDNILLGKDMVPKIADFGLSRLFGESKTHETSSRMKGTLEFMAPEYIREGAISPKNDVFSLGVIIFYLVAGRKGYGNYCDSRSSPRQEFTERVQEYWKRRMRAAVDYAWDEIDLLGVKICIEIAMNCVEKERRNRPSTKAIIDELHKVDAQMEMMSKKDTQSFTGQGNSSCRDIELDPSLELRFPFKPRKNISCCLQLTNKVDSFIAFNIWTNKKKYRPRPNKGILPPFSKSYIIVTLRAQEEAPPNMQCLDKFIVQSTRVSKDFTSQEITLGFLQEATAVDEVILPIAYVASE